MDKLKKHIEPIVRWTLLGIGLLAALFLGGCSATGGSPLMTKQGSSSAYSHAQSPQAVRFATILSVRDIELIDQPGSSASLLGAGVGGVAGYGVATLAEASSKVRALVASIGALGGAVAGKAAVATVPGQEIVVKLQPSGETIAVAQSTVDGIRFKRGQSVMLIGRGRIAPIVQ